MELESIKKMACCPGTCYGVWEFTRMPYGLTRATQTCQRGHDNILQNSKDCTDNYLEGCIFSTNMAAHINDFQRVLGQLQAAALTLRGLKCFLKQHTWYTSTLPLKWLSPTQKTKEHFNLAWPQRTSIISWTGKLLLLFCAQFCKHGSSSCRSNRIKHQI